MKTLKLALITLILISNTLFASSLLELSVEDATINQLVLMNSVRGLSTDGTRQDLEKSLLDSFKDDEIDLTIQNQIDEIKIDTPIESNPYILEILSAQSLYKSGDPSSLIILEGSVVITFKVKSDDSSQKISASKIVIDLKNKRLSALGNVSFESSIDSATNSFQNINGEIVSLDWDTNAIEVSNGIISTKRINSEGDEITFIASSNNLSYNNDSDSFILEDGVVSTNLETAYSSITAEKIAMLANGDMFLKNAFISIGRVPVLYLPYFYSPGATMVGNPAIGYESSRGLFVNTTFEIFGKYPDFSRSEKSSFSTFLSSQSSTSLYPTSSIYKEIDESELSDIDLWASKTKSYLALMYDAYQKTPYRIESKTFTREGKSAFALGAASQLNLFDSSLQLDFSSMSSFTSDGYTKVLPFSTSFPSFRYDGKFSLNYKSDILKLSLNLPFISDPKAKKAYSNRLSTFNLDSLWNSNQKFPTKYNSDIDSYKIDLSSKIEIPTTIFGDFIKDFEISSIKSSALYTWQKIDNNYKYSISSYTFPSISAKMSGTLFSFNIGKDDLKIKDDSKQERDEENLSTLKKDIQDNTKSLDKLLIGKLDMLSISSSESKSSKTYFNTSLDYLFYEDYSYKVNNISVNPDKSITKNIKKVNTSDLDFTYRANLNPKWFNFTSKLTNTYNYNEDDNKNTKILIGNENSLNLPFLGISYNFNTKLYNYNYNSDNTNYINSSFKFTKEWVKKHSLSLSHRFSIGDIYLTPKLSLELPPLTLKLSPSLYFEGYGITNNLSLNVDINNTFKLGIVNDTIKYENGFFNTSLTASYDISKSKSALRTIDPLKLSAFVSYNNKDLKQKITQSFVFTGLYEGQKNYINEIKTTYINNNLSSELNFSTLNGKITADYFRNSLTFKNLQKFWWKNRIGVNLSLDTTFNYDFNNIYATYFTFKTSLSFAVAEFLDVDFSITTSNYGFNNYYDSNGKNFSITKLIEDLARSFDIFGNGRYNTNFNLESVSFDLVHQMEDWTLHCKYTGSVVLSSYKYSFVSSLSFLIQWKTIPELRVNESIRQNLDGTWKNS